MYVLDCDQGVKIGITIDITGRVRDLERSSGQPINVWRTFPMRSANEARVIEAWAHHELAGSRTIGEWFHSHPIEAADTIERLIKWAPPYPPLTELTRERIDAIRAARQRVLEMA